MSEKDSGGGCGVVIGGIIALSIIYWVIKLIGMGVTAYARAFTVSGMVLGAGLGTGIGAGVACVMGLLWGRYRKKAEVGPVPMSHYLKKPGALRSRYLPKGKAGSLPLPG